MNKRAAYVLVPIAAIAAVASAAGAAQADSTTRTPADKYGVTGVDKTDTIPCNDRDGNGTVDVKSDTERALSCKAQKGDTVGHQDMLIISHELVRPDCPIFPNYPGGPGKDHGQPFTAGGNTISWRYYADDTYSMVSLPRSENEAGEPHWGFMESACIGKTTSGNSNAFYTYLGDGKYRRRQISVPKDQELPAVQPRLALSQTEPRWKEVRSWLGAGSHTINGTISATYATLRDDPHRLVIGNVYAGDEVHIYDEPPKEGYRRVHVPALNMSGWVQQDQVKEGRPSTSGQPAAGGPGAGQQAPAAPASAQPGQGAVPAAKPTPSAPAKPTPSASPKPTPGASSKPTPSIASKRGSTATPTATPSGGSQGAASPKATSGTTVVPAPQQSAPAPVRGASGATGPVQGGDAKAAGGASSETEGGLASTGA